MARDFQASALLDFVRSTNRDRGIDEETTGPRSVLVECILPQVDGQFEEGLRRVRESIAQIQYGAAFSTAYYRLDFDTLQLIQFSDNADTLPNREQGLGTGLLTLNRSEHAGYGVRRNGRITFFQTASYVWMVKHKSVFGKVQVFNGGPFVGFEKSITRPVCVFDDLLYMPNAFGVSDQDTVLDCYDPTNAFDQTVRTPLQGSIKGRILINGGIEMLPPLPPYSARITNPTGIEAARVRRVFKSKIMPSDVSVGDVYPTHGLISAPPCCDIS